MSLDVFLLQATHVHMDALCIVYAFQLCGRDAPGVEGSFVEDCRAADVLCT